MDYLGDKCYLGGQNTSGLSFVLLRMLLILSFSASNYPIHTKRSPAEVFLQDFYFSVQV